MNQKIAVAFTLLTGLSLTACSSPTSAGTQNQSASSSQTQGVTKNQVLVGTTCPMTGPNGQYVAIEEGANAYFNYINAKGGVNGRKIKFISLDDQFLPEKAAANAKQLVADNVFATVSTVGTADNEAADPILTKAGIPVTGITTGSSAVSFPVSNLKFAYFPTYTTEGHIAVKWLVTHEHIKTIGVFLENDDWGKEELAAINAEAKANGVKVVAEIPFNTTDTDYSTYALNMKAKHPDVVYEVGVPRATSQFMKGLEQLNWHPLQYLSYPSADPIMFKLAGTAFDKVFTSQWQPSLKSDKANVFITEFKKDYPNRVETTMGLEGWVEAQIFVQALQACGDNVTRANFTKQMENIHDWTGAASASPIGFSATNHVALHNIHIVQADAKTQTFTTLSDNLSYNQG
jgi:branched-chain amino acid transport system substrate-binding protein